MASISNPQPLQPISRTDKAGLLRRLVVERVVARSADGILFSGGLDTSILASVASAHGRRLKAVMVSVEEGTGLDEPFAALMAKELGIELVILRPKLSELLDRMPELIRILRTFDPMELRNSIVTYLALQAASRSGMRSVFTGDAADELFAGYRFMFAMPAEELPFYIRHLNEVMHFTSPVIAQALGIGTDIPYLALPIREFALSMTHDDLVGERQGQRFGKKILREAFSDLLPEEITWRTKTPIEYGSGSTGLRQVVEESVSQSEFDREGERLLGEDFVRLRDREQYFYYRIYRGLFGPPAELERSVKTCGDCRAPVLRADLKYCRMCGAYPI